MICVLKSTSFGECSFDRTQKREKLWLGLYSYYLTTDDTFIIFVIRTDIDFGKCRKIQQYRAIPDIDCSARLQSLSTQNKERRCFDAGRNLACISALLRPGFIPPHAFLFPAQRTAHAPDDPQMTGKEEWKPQLFLRRSFFERVERNNQCRCLHKEARAVICNVKTSAPPFVLPCPA